MQKSRSVIYRSFFLFGLVAYRSLAVKNCFVLGYAEHFRAFHAQQWILALLFLKGLSSFSWRGHHCYVMAV